ncbi:MAG: patatin-like phospholipase family protein [bacterium]
MTANKKRKTVGVALGGGAARGIAHVGVIKALLEHKIPIDYIAATSAGSVVASLYGAGIDIDKIVEIGSNLTWSNFSRFKLSRRSLVSSKPIQELLEKYIGKKRIKDFKIPISILVTDILTGKGVKLTDPELEIGLAVRASTSFPGIYEPTEINGVYYFDGGAAFNLPCNVVKEMGADIVIGVDVIPKITIKTLPHNVATLVDRGLDILLNSISSYLAKEADIVLYPVTERFTSFNVRRGKRLIELGYEHTKTHIDEIKSLL